MSEQSSVKKPASWFIAIVTKGLQRLVTLRLEGTPPTDMIKDTGQTWIDLLWQSRRDWSEQQDRIRLEQAFLKLAQDVERWPAPKTFLKSLPARANEIHAPFAKARPRTDAEIAAGKKALTELLRPLMGGVVVNKTEKEREH